MLPTTLIIPVRNRRAVTLGCLDHLARTGVLAWARVIVVDDGSTDGTAEAVRTAHPQVEVLPGDGDLFWTGAIVLGMRRALAQGAACCVWFNDDSHPLPGAVERVVSHALENGCIACGLTRVTVGKQPEDVYSFRKTAWGLRPVSGPADGTLLAVDACRGNLVAIPRAVVEAIGYPDEHALPHYFGDVDYTLRAVRAGFRCVQDTGAIVEETQHSGNWDESWLTTRKPLRQIWARFAWKQTSVYWHANWVYFHRHWGWWRGTILFAQPYARLACISLVRLALPAAWIRRRRAG